MKFAQIIEFTTTRIDEFNDRLDDWMVKTEGHRIPHQAVLRKDRDTEDVYLLMVEFASHEQGMENSNRPETGEFAAFLACSRWQRSSASASGMCAWCSNPQANR